MNIEEMTPEEIREFAERKQAAKEATYERYMGTSKQPKKPYVKMVEFEGTEYPVDMRRLRSRDFIRRLADLNGNAEGMNQSEQLDMFDYLFEGECMDAIAAKVEREQGFEDYIEELRIMTGIFEAVDLKN